MGRHYSAGKATAKPLGDARKVAMRRANNKLDSPKKPLTGRLFDLLASVKFAVSVVIIIAVACVVGTLLPQGADAVRFVQKNPTAAARLELFGKLGLTHVFSSVWFIGLLCVLSASVAACSTRRFATVRRTTCYARGRAFGSMLTHISFLLILAGGVMRGVWGEKGYLEFREGQTVARYVNDRGAKPLPFALHLAKFEIETYTQQKNPAEDHGDLLLVANPDKKSKTVLPVKIGVEQAFDEFKITVLKYIPDFMVDMQTREVTSRSSEPRNPAILVAVAGPNYSNHRWLFAKFPDFAMHSKDGATGQNPLEMLYQNHAATAPTRIDGPIKTFKSTVRVVEGDDVVQTRTVEVNSPFKYKGYTFYQSGYNPNDLSYTSLQVVKDPGVPVVYAGFTLMIVGLAIVFYINPWLNRRSALPGATSAVTSAINRARKGAPTVAEAS